MDVRLIAAIGRSGQLGLGGKMPWHDPEDLAWFKAQTQYGVVVAGARTMETIAAASRVGDHRAWIVAPRHVLEAPAGTRGPQVRFLEGLHEAYGGRTIWIAGGERTYAAFIPFVRRSVITHIDYDGQADAWLPHLWRTR